MTSAITPALLLCLLTGCGVDPYRVVEFHRTTRTVCSFPAKDPEPLRLLVMNFDRMEAVEASAFFLSTDGLVVTCAHVIAGGTPLGVILPGGRRVTVTTVATDPGSDLALLRADAGGRPTLMRRAVAAGTRLRAVTKDGVTPVTCVGAAVDADVGDVITFQANGLGPGASGGALIDANGAVVGVIRGGFEDGANEGVAVPVTRLIALIDNAADASRENN